MLTAILSSIPIRKDKVNENPFYLDSLEYSKNYYEAILKSDKKVVFENETGKKEEFVSAKSYTKVNPKNGFVTRGQEYTTKPVEKKKPLLVKIYDYWVRIDDEPLPIAVEKIINYKKRGRVETREYVEYFGQKLYIKSDFFGRKSLYIE